MDRRLACLVVAVVALGASGSMRARVVLPAFEEISGSSGVLRTGFSYSVAWGDYDGDGLVDLFVSYVNRPDELLKNHGGGVFENVSLQAGIVDVADSGAEGVVWGDYDNDGDLDLFVANGCEPEPNDPSVLYRNNGNGTFTVVTQQAGLYYVGKTEGTAWADYDKDGNLDLYVGHLTGGSNDLLYRSNGNGTFDNVAASARVTDARDSNGGVAWADFDNDHDLDLFVANQNHPDALYRQNADHTFDDVAVAAGVADSFNSEAPAWGDYDNDGWLDLFVSGINRPARLYHNNRDGTFTDVAPQAGVALPGQTDGANWADFDNDGWIDLFVVVPNFSAPNHLFHNEGNGTFTDVAASLGLARQENGRVGAWGDIDNDGFQDLAVGNYGTTRLFRNTGNSNHWLNVRLIGTVSNRDAIGARIEATAVIGGRVIRQTRETAGGGSRHSQDSLTVEFGLGDAASADLSITFPNGLRQQLSGVTAGQTVVVVEARPQARLVIDPVNAAAQPFDMVGWAVDLASLGGSGVDAVHVWAFPQSGGSPAFVGAAAYGSARGDVGAAFGSRFTNSGFRLQVSGLSPGAYRLIAYARSQISDAVEAVSLADVTVGGGAAMNLDAPIEGATVFGPFVVEGWAIDAAGASGTGVDTLHVYAFPDSGAPIFLGAVPGGVSRPDVSAILGARFANAGYRLLVSDLAPGLYRIGVYAHSAVSNAFVTSRVAQVTVGASAQMSIDAPRDGAVVVPPFDVAGWAVDLGAAAGTGVDTLHVYAFPDAGAPVFLGAAWGGEIRPDVAAVFGARAVTAGFRLRVNALAPGHYRIGVYAHSTFTNTFVLNRAIGVRVE